MHVDRMHGYSTDEDFVVPDSDSEEEPPRYNYRKRNCAASGKSKKQCLHGPDDLVLQELVRQVLPEQGAHIVARESESLQLACMIEQPRGGMRPIMLGPNGIGKRTIVQKTAHLLATRVNPKRKVYLIEASHFLANANPENKVEEFRSALAPLRAQKVPPVLYIRDLDVFLEDEQLKETIFSLFSSSYPMIASLRNEEKELIEKLRGYNFSPISIKECSVDETIKIVVRYLEENPPEGDVRISRKAIELSTQLAAKYDTSRPMPARAINMILQAANNVRFQDPSKPNANLGKKEIAQFASGIYGIPYEDLLWSDRFSQDRFSTKLKEQLVGQDQAIDKVCEQVASFKLGFSNPQKPWGAFLFVGPTGVGKTELARLTAKELFQDERALIRLDGTEFRESHTVSTLIGSPQGYMGHEEGGRLTEALLLNPHQVVLVDEFEKMHPDVRRLFMQVLDYGRLTDRRGRAVDCTKCVFIMTSNLGSDALMKGSNDGVMKVIENILIKELSPELLNRFTAVVPFNPLHEKLIPDVVRVQMNRIKERLAKQTSIELHWTDELLSHFSSLPVDAAFGMRRLCEMVDQHCIQALKDHSVSKSILRGKVTLDFSESTIKILY